MKDLWSIVSPYLKDSLTEEEEVRLSYELNHYCANIEHDSFREGMNFKKQLDKLKVLNEETSLTA